MFEIFNLDEILAMAEQIERNGAEFYQQAAQLVNEPSSRDLLLRLSRWELGHEQLFADMRKSLSLKERTQQVADPDGQLELYLRAIGDQHVFKPGVSISSVLEDHNSEKGLLELALGFERDSIAFFIGMKGLVPERFGGGKVDWLVEEEMRHVAVLSQQLSSLD